jgi:hypothetical protein
MIRTQIMQRISEITGDNVKKNIFIGFEVSTAKTMKNAAFWNVAQCALIVSRRFGGTEWT